MQKFEETLDTLRNVCEELRDRGIILAHLDKAIDQLNRHHENITKIENNIEAIQEEVIEPVKTELEFNKVSGRFSILGFWVGAAGLLFSLVATAVTGISSLRSDREIRELVKQGSSRRIGEFSCQIINDVPTTVIYHPIRGNVEFISWKSDFFSPNDSPERRCIQTSNRLQLAQEQGILNYLTIGQKDGENSICASSTPAGLCELELFSLRPNQDPNQVLQELMDVNSGLSKPPVVQ